MSSAGQVDHCQYFVLRKKRFCRMTVRRGEIFCGEHVDSQLVEKEGEETRQRVVCPYDGKHTCFKSQLAKHMTRCNAKPPAELPRHIVPGCNQGDGDSPERVSLSQMTDDSLMCLIDKVNAVYREHVTITENVQQHHVLAEEMSKPGLGAPALKHLTQNASLLGLMQQSGLLRHRTCYVEMGAGRGQLTYWLAQAVSDLQACTFALVDRASYRHKTENKLRGPETENITRIRADIADLCLRNVGSLESCERVVAISKHLCGAATDLALRCVVSGVQTTDEAAWLLQGVVMALCCHHRCDWTSYVGKQFFSEVGLSCSEFSAMCVLVSWATCGSGRSRTDNDDVPRQQPPAHEDNVHKDRYVRLKLPQDAREEVGRRCKYIIDFGRHRYLRSAGFSSQLLFYVPREITLENVCVVATRNTMK